MSEAGASLGLHRAGQWVGDPTSNPAFGPTSTPTFCQEQGPLSPRGPAFSALPPPLSASHLPKHQLLFLPLLLLPFSLSFLFHQHLISLLSFQRGFENKQLNACAPSSTFCWQTGVYRAGAEGQGEVRGWAPEPGTSMAEFWLQVSIPLCDLGQDDQPL